MIQIQNDQARVKVKAKKSKASKIIIDAKPDTDGVFKPTGWEDGETFSWAWNYGTESAPGTESPHTGRWKTYSDVYREAGEEFFDGFAQGVDKATRADYHGSIKIKGVNEVRQELDELQKKMGGVIDKALDDQIRKMFGL